jgi:hypothetical protein
MALCAFRIWVGTKDNGKESREMSAHKADAPDLAEGFRPTLPKGNPWFGRGRSCPRG